jgi:catechol 2,3-dioxygenase-like lactoylglutathione lyase family enzyme
MSAIIGHIILSISNFKKSCEFYDALLFPLGFKSDWMEEDERIGIKQYTSEGHTLFIRCDKKREHKEFVRDVGLDHLAIKVPERSKVDEAYVRIKNTMTMEAKEPKAFPEYSSKYYAFYFRDPDGIPFEIAFY